VGAEDSGSRSNRTTHERRRLYERLGYHAIGQSEVSWEAEAPDGSRFLYTTTVTEMAKDL
jgi:hypothetical protein